MDSTAQGDPEVTENIYTANHATFPIQIRKMNLFIGVFLWGGRGGGLLAPTIGPPPPSNTQIRGLTVSVHQFLMRIR